MTMSSNRAAVVSVVAVVATASVFLVTACGGGDVADEAADPTSRPVVDAPSSAPTPTPGTDAISPETTDVPATSLPTATGAEMPSPSGDRCTLMSTADLVRAAQPSVELVPFSVHLPGDQLVDDSADPDEAPWVMPEGVVRCGWSDHRSGLEEGEWDVVVTAITGADNLSTLGFDPDNAFGEDADMGEEFAVDVDGATGAFWSDRGMLRTGAAFDGERFVTVQVLAPEGAAFDGPAVMAAALAAS